MSDPGVPPVSLANIEGDLLQLQVTRTGQDQVRYATKLIGKLNHLAQVTSIGDFPPTDQAVGGSGAAQRLARGRERGSGGAHRLGGRGLQPYASGAGTRSGDQIGRGRGKMGRKRP